MDDLLSAALSESGLDLSLDDESANHFETGGGPHDGKMPSSNIEDRPITKLESLNGPNSFTTSAGRIEVQ